MTRYRLFGRAVAPLTTLPQGNLNWIRNNLSSAISLCYLCPSLPLLPSLVPQLLLNTPSSSHRASLSSTAPLLPWFSNAASPTASRQRPKAVQRPLL